MTLDWTTFFLEMINFLVLVWILKHFLYKPVLAVLAQRRSMIDKLLVEARSSEERAAAIQAECEAKQSDWEREKHAAHERLEAEIGRERDRRMQALAQALETERERNQACEEKRLAEEREMLKGWALDQGRQFVSALLDRLADPALEARLVEIFVEDLANLSGPELEGLLGAAAEQGAEAKALSAFPLSEAQRGRVERGFEKRLGYRLPMRFGEAPELLSGLHVSLGAWQLKLSLSDELRHFAPVESHEA